MSKELVVIQSNDKERAVAVAVNTGYVERETTQEYLDELVFLAETAGAEVLETFYQERHRLDLGTAIGKGKAEEIKEFVKENEISLVLFDNDLSPAQVRNLEKIFEVKVIDRTGLILDIFASRARTMEAKTQVELAQAQYLLPRLSRMWTHLSKQLGGIGTKGPGETQIETDRRILRDRIAHLKEKLERIDRQREQQRKGRDELPRFALVGYTNVGKSTLMNALASSDVYVQNQLFATLDTTVRAIELPNGRQALLSDTVGFIRKLPPNLVASFRSTLAEIIEADVLLHVVDASHPACRDHIRAVNDTLKDIKAAGKPTVIVFNKADAVEDPYELMQLHAEWPDSVAVSARTRKGLPELLQVMEDLSSQDEQEVTLLIPYTRMELLPKLYDSARVIQRVDASDGVGLVVKVKSEMLPLYSQWQVALLPDPQV